MVGMEGMEGRGWRGWRGGVEMGGGVGEGRGGMGEAFGGVDGCLGKIHHLFISSSECILQEPKTKKGHFTPPL